MKFTQIIIIVITLFIISFNVSFYVKPVYALSPVVNNICSSGDQTTTNVSCTITTSPGETLVVFIGSATVNGNPSANVVVSISDGGDTFTKQISNSIVTLCCSGAGINTELWSATHISGVSAVVTATMTLSGANVIATDVDVLSISNLASPNAVITAIGSCNVNPGTCGILKTTTSDVFDPATDIAISGWGGRGASVLSNGLNFTPNPTDGAGNCKIAGVSQSFCQEYTTNGAASPTNYPMVCATCSSSNVVTLIGVGAIFGVSHTVANPTVTSTTFVTQTIQPSIAKCTDTNSCVTNQFSQFLILLLPSLIIIALFEFITYKIGIKDERVYVLVFMFAISAIGFLSALGAFGTNGIPFYIPIFCDIVGFMLILTFKRNSSGF